MASKKKIAVAGATGRLGRPTVEILRERGHEVVPISRSEGVDVITGEGLAAALEGVDLIIDAATSPSPDQAQATEFFTTAARNLQQAGAERGVEAILVVSIIGTDHFNTGYNAAKVVQERAHLDGPVPARILRAAQFHEFVAELVEWSTQGENVKSVSPFASWVERSERSPQPKEKRNGQTDRDNAGHRRWRHRPGRRVGATGRRPRRLLV
ncbi:MAG TPA: NAD(P)H-binding protein [Solirubrobacterales bacterium]|nr:NAD(P)H-binding protein [Solirubrobacterales bacterium]